MRFAIAHAFVEIFDAPPPEEWNSVRCSGDGAESNNGWIKGTIVLIAEYLKIDDSQRHAHRDIRAVLERVDKCARLGQQYDGRLCDEPVKVRLERRLIQPGSFDEQIVADCTEAGMSLTKTMHMVNAHRFEDETEHVGRSAVYTAYKALQPEESIVRKRKQCGGPEWAAHRHAWVAQKMVRFGIPVPEQDRPPDWGKPGA